jgi:hypothetical protein
MHKQTRDHNLIDLNLSLVTKEMCEPCKYNKEEHEATYICNECKEYLCDNCMKYHRAQKQNRSHPQDWQNSSKQSMQNEVAELISSMAWQLSQSNFSEIELIWWLLFCFCARWYLFHNGQPSHGGDRKTFKVMTSTLLKICIHVIIKSNYCT